MNPLSVPAEIVGKIGPVRSENVNRVLLRVADTVSVRSWLSTPIDAEGGGTRYFGLEARVPGRGRDGGTIDEASDDDVEEGVVDDADGVDAGVVGDGESSRTFEDEAKEEASWIWGITAGLATRRPGNVSDERAIEAIVCMFRSGTLVVSSRDEPDEPRVA